MVVRDASETGPSRVVEILTVAEVGPLVSDTQWIAAAFTPEELSDLGDRRNRPESLVARVAAKRAVLGLGRGKGPGGADVREPEALRAVEVFRGPDGGPEVRTEEEPDRDILLSISHDGGLAGALAVLRDRDSRAG